jgi:hypothetical protein
LKALLREENADPMSQMTTAAISKRENSILRSREKANDLCSLLCAYRLLDVMLSMEFTEEESTSPVLHNQMGVDLPKNEVRARFHFATSLLIPSSFFKKKLKMILRKRCDCSRIGPFL